jgi:hypothetical protein
MMMTSLTTTTSPTTMSSPTTMASPTTTMSLAGSFLLRLARRREEGGTKEMFLRLQSHQGLITLILI